LGTDEIVTESGRVFRPAHNDLLDSLPPDIVQEMARRRLEEIKISAAEQRSIFFLPEKLHSGAHTLIPPQSGGVCTPSARIKADGYDIKIAVTAERVVTTAQ
jgi:hypothetical protein